jgi:hypothetical protein
MARLALPNYIRSFGIENFAIEGDQVRVGSRFWRADECRCALEACEGWAMIPVRPAKPREKGYNGSAS